MVYTTSPMPRLEREPTSELQLFTKQLFHPDAHAPAIHTLAFPGYGSPTLPNGNVSYFTQAHEALHAIEPAHHRLTTINWPASTSVKDGPKNKKSDFSLDRHPLVIQQVIEKIDDELMDAQHVRIMGHSMGGLAVLRWAGQQSQVELQSHQVPQFFRRHPSVELILEMPVLQVHDSLMPRMNVLRMVDSVPFLNRLLTDKVIHAAMYDLRLNKFVADASLIDGGRYYDHTVQVNDPQALLHQAIQLSRLRATVEEYSPALQFLSSHGIPTHFIFAQHDSIVADCSTELCALLEVDTILGSISMVRGAHHTEDVHTPKVMAQVIADTSSYHPLVAQRE